jgi:hypothetical protein
MERRKSERAEGIKVVRLDGTNRVFIRTTWESGVSPEILLRIAQHQEAWYKELCSYWLK